MAASDLDPNAALAFDSSRSPVLGTRGMVASSEPLATAAGLDVLREGGNAADAAVAVAAALAVTEPVMTGIGGDCFALWREASTGRIRALNGSGRAPAALDLARVAADGFADGLPDDHAHCVTVPGACAGWCDLVEAHGRLPLDRILAPAIRLAEEGFPVAPITSVLWAFGSRTLHRTPGGAALLIEGRPPRAGERFRNPGLARTLRRVALHGRDGFYRGAIARAIAEVVQHHGGVLDVADLAEHRSTWDEPISLVYRGLRVWQCPPNGQGLAALLALGLLRGFDLDGQAPTGPDRFHLMIESMRLAFEDARAVVADPAFAPVPVQAMLDEDWLARRRSLVDPQRANPDARAGVPLPSSDTVQFCVVDGEGNACSFINSNYQYFGTGLVPGDWGFTLQNRGLGFSLDPAHPNALVPRKRPYHTIIPGLLTRESDGSLYAPFGVMGGFMQPQGHLQVVVAMADDGVDPQAALDRARFQLVPREPGRTSARVLLESQLPEETREELARRGHAVETVGGILRAGFGRGQIIRRDPDGVLWGGSDPRADGCAMPL